MRDTLGSPSQTQSQSEIASPAKPDHPTPSALSSIDAPPQSYQVTTSTAPSAATPTVPQGAPDNTFLYYNQTTFMIRSTFIHTLNGPVYHLSSLLYHPNPKLRIRRLKTQDLVLIQSGLMRNVTFDKSTTLYKSLCRKNTCYVESKMNDGWPGTVRLHSGFRWWHVRPELQQGVTPATGLRCGRKGSWEKQILRRSNEMEPSEWKDAQGNVLATDVFALQNGKSCRELN
jgi:hypothetical protein